MNKKNDLGPCILADKLTLFQPGGRLSPADCPPPLQFLDLAPYLHCIFAVLGIKTLKIHSIYNKASIAHLVIEGCEMSTKISGFLKHILLLMSLKNSKYLRTYTQ